jgi:hypothetical protein
MIWYGMVWYGTVWFFILVRAVAFYKYQLLFNLCDCITVCSCGNMINFSTIQHLMHSQMTVGAWAWRVRMGPGNVAR